MKTPYVLGFLFVKGQVVLISKLRPDFQAGKLNGVGGHIEPGETPNQAMAREWFEETGERRENWDKFCSLELSDCVIYCFRAVDTNTTAHTMTDEYVHLIPLEFLYLYHRMPNLDWMIPLAMSGDRLTRFIKYEPQAYRPC